VHELAAGKTVPRVRVGIDMDEAGGLRAPRPSRSGSLRHGRRRS
jgi:hypothetical protein